MTTDCHRLENWPNAVLHIDSDAFFASCEKAVAPYLKNKPVVTGAERGIATSVCYIAKKLGIKRGMLIRDIKKQFPQVIVKNSQYKLYSLISNKMTQILSRFTDKVENYSIDESFLDLTNLNPAYHCSYKKLGKTIKETIKKELDITVSIGISLTKTLAKSASKHQKPDGLTVVAKNQIKDFLSQVAIQDVWGIGNKTADKMIKLGIKTALDFTDKDLNFVKKHFYKPQIETYFELKGIKIYDIIPDKEKPKSITRSQTFYPSTKNIKIIKSHLFANIDSSFRQLRKLNLLTNKIAIFIKTQQFIYLKSEINLTCYTAYPLLIYKRVEQELIKIYKPNLEYRATGVVLFNLKPADIRQLLIFDNLDKEAKLKKLYEKIDFVNQKYPNSLTTGLQIYTKPKKQKRSLFLLNIKV
ncbi:MAG: hypothetical protein KatS3mg090_0370 [Patescibacteria group bacterium]|nr:MAG: hypothetical protein KatS3mg090_0370 [Patescibacteria group bacterium]